MIPTSF